MVCHGNQALAARTQELERLKSDWSSHTASLSTEHTTSLNLERERALESQKKAQWSFEQEKKDLERAHQERVRNSMGLCASCENQIYNC